MQASLKDSEVYMDSFTTIKSNVYEELPARQVAAGTGSKLQLKAPSDIHEIVM